MNTRIGDMDKLFAGLSSTDTNNTVDIVEEQKENTSSTLENGTKNRKPKNVEYERICTCINKEVMNKVRTLSKNEGVSIKDILSYGIQVVISAYEDKYGKIRTKKNVKGNIEYLLKK